MVANTRIESIDPNLLIIPESYKADPHELANMIESVKNHGIFHAPLVREDYNVFAGRLRVIAARACDLVEIECKIYPSDLPEDDYRVISLHENLKRYNLPWYDQIMLEKQLHELRQDQMGPGKQGKKVGWSLRDTASELSMSFGILSEDLRMADAILLDPSLKKIQDKSTARRVIFESIKRINQEVSAGAQMASFDTNVCHYGSSEALLKMYPDNSFDACITDPPWLEFKDQSLTKDAFTLDVFREVFRVLKANGFLYAFVSTQDWVQYREDFTQIGFSVQKWPLIWVKENVLTQGTRSWEYQRDYEPIILAVKGSPAKTQSMLSSIMSCPVVPSAHLTHPNEKPIAIIKRLLDHCTYDGSIVLDPFAGSFVVPEACKLTGRRFVAIEKDRKFYSQGLERLGMKNG